MNNLVIPLRISFHPSPIFPLPHTQKNTIPPHNNALISLSLQYDTADFKWNNKESFYTAVTVSAE